MAFVREEDDEGKQVVENPSTGSTSGGVIGTGSQAQQGGKKGSGSFTNLQSYIEVNKPQAGQFADNTVNTFKGNVGGIERQINTEEIGGFQKQVDQNTIKDDPNLRNMRAGEMNQDQLASYGSRLNGQYTGPTAFTSERGFNQLDEKSTQATNADSFTGKKQLAKEMYGVARPRYTQGEQTLDTLFLDSRDNRGKFTDLKNWMGGEADRIKQGAMSKADQFVQNAQKSSAATAQLFKDDLAGDQTALDQALLNEVAAENARRKAAYAEAVKNAGTAGLDEWSAYSPGGIAGGSSRDISQADYMKYGGDVGWQNVVTDQQLADAQALATLAGSENKYLGQRTAADDPYKFNEANYNQAVQQARAQGQTLKQQYDQGLQSAVAPVKERMKELWGLSQIGMGGTPDADNAIYNQVKDQPIPPNPMGFSTYGEYLNSLGITNGSDLVDYFASTENWQVSGDNDIRAGG